MAKIQEYLKDAKGNPSSTRLFSWYTLWIFFIVVLVELAVVFPNMSELSVNGMIFLLVLDFILLLAVYAPKQLAKIQEIKELIELTKNGKF